MFSGAFVKRYHAQIYSYIHVIIRAVTTVHAKSAVPLSYPKRNSHNQLLMSKNIEYNSKLLKADKDRILRFLS